MKHNTVFLRLEGPLQAWGKRSKMIVRRSSEAPTKSGVLGLICCAMGLTRTEANNRLPELNELTMGVRVDRKGVRWWDWHTVGAHVGVLSAQGKVKKTEKTKEIETLTTRREYLAGASFLVALQGEPCVIHSIAQALKSPKWPIFLGRRSCVPSVPVLASPETGHWEDLESALKAVPWIPGSTDHSDNNKTKTLSILTEWRPNGSKESPSAVFEIWCDTPLSFDPPAHGPRIVLRNQVEIDVAPSHRLEMKPPRPRADYTNSEYRRRRAQRLQDDHFLCVFCKSPASTVQHVTYRRAGGNEDKGDLRSLCRLCHDAVTMVEYGLNMGLDRINPEDPKWRDQIIRTREKILLWRNEELRRRLLRNATQEIRKDVLGTEE